MTGGFGQAKVSVLKVNMTKNFFSVFRSLMRVQTDFKIKICLKCLKTSNCASNSVSV